MRLHSFVLCIVFWVTLFLPNFSVAYAAGSSVEASFNQVDDEGNRILWQETFGNVAPGKRINNPNVKNNTYYERGTLYGYAVVSRAKDITGVTAIAFSAGTDHTGDENGGFVFINVAKKGDLIYEQKITYQLCENTEYNFFAYAASSGDASIRLEIVGEDGTILEKYTTPHIPQVTSTSCNWQKYSLTFNSRQNKNITLRVYSDELSGTWNDLIMDDITLSIKDVKTPKLGLTANAKLEYTGRKGESVSLKINGFDDWATLYGANKVYCVWESSTGTDWEIMPESGFGVSSITTTLEDSRNYRCIVSVPSSEAEAIANAKSGFIDMCNPYCITETIPTILCSTAEAQLSSHLITGTENDVRNVKLSNFQEFDDLYGAANTYYLWQRKESGGWTNVSGGYAQHDLDVTITTDMDNALYRVIVSGTGEADAKTLGTGVNPYTTCPRFDMDSFYVSYCPAFDPTLDTDDYVGCVTDGAKSVGLVHAPTLSSIDVHWEWIQPGLGIDDWKPIKIGSDPMVTDVEYQGTTQYRVFMTYKNCVSDTVTASVTYMLPDTLNLDADKINVCEKETVTLTVASKRSAVFTWWEKAKDATVFTEVSGASGPSLLLNPTQTTSYYATSKNSGGYCADNRSNTITITVEDSVRFTLSASQTLLCKGEAVDLKVTGLDSQYEPSLVWSRKVEGESAEDFASATLQSSDAPLANATYTATAQGQYCPKKSETVEVEVKNRNVLSMSVSQNKVCENGEITLNISADNYDNVVLVTTSEGNSESRTIAAAEATQLNIAAATDFELKETSAVGCAVAEPIVVHVDVEDSVKFTLSASQTLLCKGEAVDLKVTGLDSQFEPSLVWTKQLEGESAEDFASATLQTSDAPLANASYTATAQGQYCPKKSETIEVEVKNRNVLAMSASQNKVCENGEVTLNISADNYDNVVLVTTSEGNSESRTIAAAEATQLNIAAATDFELKETSAVGCAVAEPIVVHVDVEDSVKFTLSASQALLCKGEAVDLKVTGLDSQFEPSLVWSRKVEGESAEDFASATLQTSDTPLANATYTATAQGQYCPKKSETIEVEVQNRNVLSMSVSQDKVCENGEVTLNISADNYDNVVLVTTSEGNSESRAIAAAEATQLNIAAATDFELKETSAVGCAVAEPVLLHVDVEDSVRFTLSASQALLCKGEAVDLKVTGLDSQYEPSLVWSKQLEGESAEDFASATLQTSDAPLANASYTATAQGQYCPKKSETIAVEVQNRNVLAMSVSQNKVCENGEITLNISAENYDNIVLVTTSEGNSESRAITAAEATQLNIAAATDFELKETSAVGCAVAEPVVVHVDVEDSVRFTLSASQTLLCKGEAVDLKVTGLDSQYEPSLVWSKQLEGESAEDFASATLQTSDTPLANASYTATAQGQYCPKKSETVEVEVQNRNVLAMSASQNKVCENGEITLNISADNYDNIVLVTTSEGNSESRAITAAEATQLNIAAATDFELKETSAVGCAVAEPVVVHVDVEDSVKFTLSASQKLLCKGEAVDLKVTGLDSQFEPSLVWSRKVEGESTEDYASATLQTSDTPLANASYTATAQGEYCPKKSETVEVEVQNRNVLSMSVSQDKVCENGEITLNISAENYDNIVLVTTSEGNSESRAITAAEATQLNIAAATDFELKETSAVGCAVAEPVVVHVDVEDSVKFTLSASQALLCKGEAVDLKVTGLDSQFEPSLVWSRKLDGESTEDFASATLQSSDAPLANATYTATAQGQYCPKKSETIAVEVEPISAISLSSAVSTVCVNSEVLLSATTNSTHPLVWEKKSASDADFTLFDSSTDKSASLRLGENTVFRVSTSGAVACANDTSDIVEIQVEDSVKITLPNLPETVCPGTDVELRLELEGDASSIVWKQNGTVISGDSELSRSVTIDQDATFKVTATARYCPSDIITTSIQVEEIPTWEISLSKDSICEGESVTLSSNFPYADGLRWETSLQGSATQLYESGSAEITDAPVESTYYTLKASTAGNCEAGEKRVFVHVDKSIDQQLNDTIICEGDSVALAFRASFQYRYEWATDHSFDNIISTGNRLLVKPVHSTTYYIRVTNHKCQTIDEVAVDVNSNPAITTCDINENRQLVVEATGGTGRYEFDFGDGFTTSNVRDDASVGIQYTIYVKDDLGCAGDTTVRIKGPDIVIPDFFTPDDDALNDTWHIVGLSSYHNYMVTIFDRFGKKLFESSDANNDWNGTYQGHPMPSTDYWYTIFIHDVDRFYSGHFTLLRQK